MQTIENLILKCKEITEEPSAVTEEFPALEKQDFQEDERGMATAEYAIATLAAVAFAGMLLVIMKSDEVRGFLTNIIQRALNAG
ncbi:MAG: DUF4244 domain-containing protein [Micrococcaceae bacterium]